MVFQILDLPFGSALFKTARAQMPTVKGNIAQGTYKPAADGTGNNCLFAGMIKTAGLFIHLQCLADAAFVNRFI
jgi:hypothetical protein